jgi:ABC-type transport system involved in multi-copper enzyme maturation permease subunit
MNAIWPVALISFREGLRHRVLYGVMIFALLLMVFSVLFSGMFLRDILKITLDICLSAVSIGGLFVPVFIGISLLSGDIDNKSIYTILARPISRAQYVYGKFAGLALLAAVIIGILTCATLATVWTATLIYPANFFSNLSITSILFSSSMTLLGIMVLNSTVILWCSVTTSSFLATMLTLATYLVGVTVEDVVRFIALKIPGVSISPVVSKVANLTLYIFPNLAAFDFKLHAAHGLKISLVESLWAVVYGFSYLTVILLIAIQIFRRRDLP